MLIRFSILALLALFCLPLHSQLNYTISSGNQTFAAIPPVPSSQVFNALSVTSTGVLSPAGFSFAYEGTTYTDFVIVSYGMVVLGVPNTTGGEAWGPALSKLPQIAPYFMPSMGYHATSKISWDYQGGILTVEWLALQDIGIAAGSTAPAEYSFQALLDTATGTIEFRYAPLGGGAFIPRPNMADTVGLQGTKSFGGRVALPAQMPGFIDAEGAVQAWPADSFVRFAPSGTTRSAPTVTISAHGTGVWYENVVDASTNEPLTNLAISITVTDADGDQVAVTTTIQQPTGGQLLEAEFSSASAAAPYTLLPTTGSMSPEGWYQVLLRIYDGQDGIRLFWFYVRTPGAPGTPTYPPPDNIVADIIFLAIALPFIAASGKCAAEPGSPTIPMALTTLAILALTRRKAGRRSASRPG